MTDLDAQYDLYRRLHADAITDRHPMGRGWTPIPSAVPYQSTWRNRRHQLTVIWSLGWHNDDPADADRDYWLHVSCSRVNMTPSHEHMTEVKDLFIGPERWAYSVWAPVERHINIHATTLHLWAPAANRPRLPDFGRHGTI